MTVPIIIAIIGGILLLVGLLGGGIGGAVTINPIHPGLRVVSGLAGVGLIVASLVISLKVPKPLDELPTPFVPDTGESPEPAPVEVTEPIVTSQPTDVPSPTETSIPTEVLSPTPTIIPEPFVKITDPADDGTLTCDNPADQSFCLFTVEGETGGVGSFIDYRIFVFVFPAEPSGSGWYFQKQSAGIESNGDWTQSPSYIGSDGAPAASDHTLRVRAALVARDATLDDERLADLAASNRLIVLSAVEDIEGIVAISDIVDLTLAR